MSAQLQVERLESRDTPAVITLTGGLVTITGTADADHVRVAREDHRIVVTMSSATVNEEASFDRGKVAGIRFNGGDGDDVFLNDTARPSTAVGGAGDDYLEGGPGKDRLYGEWGDDTLVGFTGRDRLRGGEGKDWLYGMTGRDRLRGEGEKDWLYGGRQSDRLSGGGGAGDDVMDRATDGRLFYYTISEKLANYYVPPETEEVARYIYNYTNLVRLGVGVAPLTWNPKLVQVAQHHADTMARYERVAYIFLDDALPWLTDRLRHYGYEWADTTENVGAGLLADGDRAGHGFAGYGGWMLKPKFTEIGVGVSAPVDGWIYFSRVIARPAS